MSQIKEQNKTPEKELNRMETSNLPDAEFKTVVIRMLNELKGRVEERSENFNKEVENIKVAIANIKKNQSEMKNTLGGINRRQRNMSQIKEQNKTPEKELNRMETSNLPDAEFKTVVIRMLNELKGRVEERSENFNKEVENIKVAIANIKKNQSEMKNTLGGINSKLDETEDRISNLEDKVAENTQSEQQEKGI